MTARLSPERIAELRKIAADHVGSWPITTDVLVELLDAYETMAAAVQRLRDALTEIAREGEAEYNHRSLLVEIARRALDGEKT